MGSSRRSCEVKSANNRNVRELGTWLCFDKLTASITRFLRMKIRQRKSGKEKKEEEKSANFAQTTAIICWK
jgi:hypothetical protein